MIDVGITKPIFRNLSASPEHRDLSRYVIDLKTHKTLGMSAGFWQATLTPNADIGESPGVTADNWESFIYRTIHPQDIVVLGVESVDEQTGEYGEQIWMMGFVNRVFKRKSQRGNQVSRSIIANGFDGTKAFVKDEVALAPELATDPKVRKAFEDIAVRLDFLGYIRGLIPVADGTIQNVFLNCSPIQAVYWCLANIPAMRILVDYFEDGESKPFEIFKAMLSAYFEDRLFDANLNMYAGTVANYMQQTIDPMFYESYVDTLPHNSPLNTTGLDRPILIVRPKPYDHEYELDSDGIEIDRRGLAILEPEPIPVSPPSAASVNSTRTFATVSSQSQPLPIAPTSEIVLPVWEELTSPITGRIEVFYERQILQKDIGVSDDEVFTMFKLFGERDLMGTTPVGRFGYYFPILDVAMMQKYGLRELEGRSKMVAYAIDFNRRIIGKVLSGLEDVDYATVKPETMGYVIVPPDIADQVPDDATMEDIEKLIDDPGRSKLTPHVSFLTKVKRDRLWRWNRYNHFLESGPVTVRGRNVFVGSKIVLPEEPCRQGGPQGLEFYCVGVSQQYQFGMSWTTSLQLTRGHNPLLLQQYHDERGFNKPIGEANSVFTAEAFRNLS